MGCVEGFTNMEGGEQLALPLTSTSYTTLPHTTTTTTTETSAAPRSPVVVRPAQPSDAGAMAANKKRDTSGSKVDRFQFSIHHNVIPPKMLQMISF